MTDALLSSAGEMTVPFLVCLSAALVAVAIFRRRWTKWRPVLISLMAAAPLPTLVIALCVLVFIKAANSTREHCGVDACGMAMGFAAIIAIDFAVIFLLTWLIGYGALRIVGRRR